MESQDTPQKMDMKTITKIVYGCWAAGFLSYTMHIAGFLPLAALIIASIKRKEAAGTIYESHFVWVIRSFIIAFIAVIILAIPFWGFATGGLLILPPLWMLYRLVKGGLCLMDNRPIEDPKSYF